MGRPRSTACKDCGSSVGLDWSVLAGYSSGGAHSARCHSCYLAYTRSKQNARLHGRTYRNPGLLAAFPLGPPRPKGGLIFQCVDCGCDYHKFGTAERCADCSVANEAARRGIANARRLAAQQRGDRGITWRKLGVRDGWCCHLCGELVPEVAGTAHKPMGGTVDHLVPIVAGGEHVWSNVALAHRVCNLARGAKPLDDLRPAA